MRKETPLPQPSSAPEPTVPLINFVEKLPDGMVSHRLLKKDEDKVKNARKKAFEQLSSIDTALEKSIAHAEEVQKQKKNKAESESAKTRKCKNTETINPYCPGIDNFFGEVQHLPEKLRRIQSNYKEISTGLKTLYISAYSAETPQHANFLSADGYAQTGGNITNENGQEVTVPRDPNNTISLNYNRFFNPPPNLKIDSKYRAAILIHEMSHYVADTEDHAYYNGENWYLGGKPQGIKGDAVEVKQLGFTATQLVKNADSYGKFPFFAKR